MKFRTPFILACVAAIATMSPAFGAEEKVAAAAPTTTATADAKPKLLVKQCAAVSGSHIRPRKENDCKTNVGPMRSYSQEDLQRTGQIDVADALRRLDPIFR
jgi:hypothetical protein